MNDATNYPLYWPTGWPRTPRPRASAFGNHTMARAIREVQNEVQRLGARRLVISTNVPVRLDGLPYSNMRQPNDVGVAVYFLLNGKPIVLPCDRWSKVEHNLWAVAKHIEAMRGQDRWGVGNMERRFAGYAALPAAQAWWEILGVARDADMAVVRGAWKALLKKNHPDVGGNSEFAAKLNAAFAEAEQERAVAV